MKRGRPLLLGQELDTKVQYLINELRSKGGNINTRIVKALAKGVVISQDRTLLRENGGGIDISRDWTLSIMKRMNLVKRRGSNTAKPEIKDFDEKKAKFLKEIKTICTTWRELQKLYVVENLVYVYVPAGFTSKLQPMDLSVQKCVKDRMRDAFEDHYPDKVAKSLQDKTEVVVDLTMTTLKPLSAKWLVSAIDYLLANPQIVFNGFHNAGIAQTLGFVFEKK
ncbi:unnamed protein product [Mytilus coruscus]|uniref:Uncharacterized protein n=1 Tax=Mytilus coruscus TaxID=42192 RepID=A0A6J8CIT4_MYTCO|nr:unnamed protein product [Mytilus coruscus]